MIYNKTCGHNTNISVLIADLNLLSETFLHTRSHIIGGGGISLLLNIVEPSEVISIFSQLLPYGRFTQNHYCLWSGFHTS